MRAKIIHQRWRPAIQRGKVRTEFRFGHGREHRRDAGRCWPLFPWRGWRGQARPGCAGVLRPQFTNGLQLPRPSQDMFAGAGQLCQLQLIAFA